MEGRGLAIISMIGLVVVIAPVIIIFSSAMIMRVLGSKKEEKEPKHDAFKKKDSALWDEEDVDSYLRQIGMKK